MAKMIARQSEAARPAGAPSVAVIVPILDEERAAAELGARLASLGARAEVIIVDGRSADRGPEILARVLPSARVVTAPRGRARQMNAGAHLARAPVLLFLHADTTLPPGALAAVERAVDSGAGFGCFPVAIDSRDPRLRLAARVITLRSRLLPSATGDQAMFVRRDLFLRAGGFPEVELCEDLALVARLRRHARFTVADAPPVLTSARRWQRCGVWRTTLLMWSIRAGWHLGVPPSLLARFYQQVR